MPSRASFSKIIIQKDENYKPNPTKLQNAINTIVRELIKEHPEILRQD